MNKKFIIRSLAAAAVSFAAKILVKKIQEKSEDKNRATGDKSAKDIDAPDTNAYPPQGASL